MAENDVSLGERWRMRARRIWRFGAHAPARFELDEESQRILDEADAAWHSQYTSMQDISSGDPAHRKDYLLAIYQQLYGELRAREQQERQWTTWTFSLLTLAAVLGADLKKAVDFPAAYFVFAALTLFTALSTYSVWDNVRGKIDIMQNIDRMHQVMGAFTKGCYYESSSLLQPSWYGWGFYQGASHRRFARYCILAMWLMVALDAAVLLW